MRALASLAAVTIRCAWVGLLAVLLVPAGPAQAANQPVAAISNVFVPADVTVQQGDTVTWSNHGGTHNVRFDDGSFEMPADPATTAWSVSRSFDAAGVFRYYCEEHGTPNGGGMSGAVNVQAAGAPPPPPAGEPVFADRIAPALRLSGSRRQRVLRQRAVFVRAVVSEASSVTARARVYVPRAGKPLRTREPVQQLVPQRVTNLRLGLSKRTLSAFRRALRKHSRLTAKITVTAKDSAGNRAVAKRTVKLKK